MIYSKRLKELREEQNIKQYELSNYLQFSKEVYGNFERENTLIPIKYLNILANYFNCSIDYLFNFTNNKSYQNIQQEINYNLQKLRLKELRKEQKLTQKELAKAINVAPSTIGDYEKRNNGGLPRHQQSDSGTDSDGSGEKRIHCKSWSWACYRIRRAQVGLCRR